MTHVKEFIRHKWVEIVILGTLVALVALVVLAAEATFGMPKFAAAPVVLVLGLSWIVFGGA